jgi:hypothetical protein
MDSRSADHPPGHSSPSKHSYENMPQGNSGRITPRKNTLIKTPPEEIFCKNTPKKKFS